MQYLWSKVSVWSIEKKETILILISLKTKNRILKIQYLTLVFFNFKGAL